MRPTRQWRMPNSNWGWHRYFVNRFNKNLHPDAEHLAMFYLMSHLAHEEDESNGLEQPPAAGHRQAPVPLVCNQAGQHVATKTELA